MRDTVATNLCILAVCEPLERGGAADLSQANQQAAEAQQEAQRSDPHASALLLDHNGHLTETAAANFLIVQKGTVLSPPTGTVLQGVSLKVVRELCARGS